LLTGMGVGFSVQVAQYIGARKTQAVKETIRQALLAALALGGILLLIFQSLASFLPVWMGAEAAIQSEAIIYLRLIMTVLPCMACSAVFSATLRCMGDTRTPMLLNLGANVLNALLNFLLIYEPRMLRLGGLEFHMWGAGMGVAGAALATAIATGIAGLLMTIAIYRRKGEYKVSLRDSYRPNRLILSTALRLGIPVAMERSVISFGHIALTKVVSKLGTVALAANSIAMSAESFCYLPPNGISFAATTLVGQCMGAGEKDEAQQFGWLCAKSSMFLGIFTGVLLFVVARPLAGFFSPDQAVVAMAASMLRIVSFIQPFSNASIVLIGALRGAGDSKYPFYINLVSMWGIRVLCSPLFIFVFHMGLAGVWVAMSLDLLLRGSIYIIRFRRGKWKQTNVIQQAIESEELA
jgi:putative MATE family efflux protein